MCNGAICLILNHNQDLGGSGTAQRNTIFLIHTQVPTASTDALKISTFLIHNQELDGSRTALRNSSFLSHAQVLTASRSAFQILLFLIHIQVLAAYRTADKASSSLIQAKGTLLAKFPEHGKFLVPPSCPPPLTVPNKIHAKHLDSYCEWSSHMILRKYTSNQHRQRKSISVVAFREFAPNHLISNLCY